ncbi:GNAT family N-acetyltransferase [Chitinimonas sp. BJB300]|uniref:GNAT family N-acetyltransferase n=1 Tax=Chitinimonas sp. BJB300 TaxID=1559339 RepID=UPI000C0F0448|nr:GNAT family N-acetyltransferase [Chitinimonas sp. BJB300]PHV12465.1 GNAT family N-acetyltransferase [Chitinimonas sp. BJB300]TSJ89146.1 GNAT family N-acetyltransferase [Chitinimonas sp. BJB300]
MLIKLDLADALQAGELLNVQRHAYRQEAELIGYANLPPLRETLSDLMDCGETLIGWREDGELLGAVGLLTQEETLEICRLVVAPHAQRRGIARALLTAVISQAGQQAVRVSTAAANTPAITLYENHGFRLVSETRLPDGLMLIAMQRG